MPQIEVTFDIDANGILHVRPKDKATGKENKITIKANSGLSDEEVERMVQDAAAHAEDDRKVRLVDARNQLDGLVHSVKKAVAEHGDKVGADEKAKIEEAIKGSRRGDQERRQGNDRCQERSPWPGQPEARRTHVRPGPGRSRPAAGRRQFAWRQKADDADVVDAEFTEVKDQK